MKNKILRILSLALAVTTTLSTSIPVFAYDVDEHDNTIESVEYQNTEDENFNNTTNVFAQLGSEYKVTIPKVVVLSGVSKAASYYVKVEGDIAGYEKVKVVPEDSFKLSAKNKADETATISQDKTVWTVHDFDTDANGQISADEITAGKWTGAFNFNINLETEKVAGDIVIEEPAQTLAAGLYNENDNLIKSWDELVELGLNIEKNYYFDDYKTEATSGYSIFKNNNLSGKLIIPASVTSIGQEAFYGCASLTQITIPNSVTYIDNTVFTDCTSLTSVTIPDSVTSIGINAFRYCKSLESIIIPNSVTYIDAYAFKNCTSLKSITIPDSVTSIEVGTFEGCESLTQVTIPESITNIDAYAFEGCRLLESVIIPDLVTSINNNAFQNCTSLTQIIIPDSVTSIGNNAFNGCTSLTSVIYRDVTYTDKNAFNNKLKSDGVATTNVWT